jgi:starch synthase
MRILFCASEVYPFAKTGGLADVCGAIPLALEKIGIEVTVVMPFYGSIDTAKFNIEKINSQFARTFIGQGVEVYFVQHDVFFRRDGIYGDGYKDYPDNLQRFQFFSQKVFELIKQVKLEVDVIHCHDWQTALIPAYLTGKYKVDPLYKDIKTILTIHNLAYQGLFDKGEYRRLGLSAEFQVKHFDYYDKINLMKAGLELSDVVTTVSKQYAKEILTKEFGCGLEGILKGRKEEIFGITNGIDYDIWNPEEDKSISTPFSVKDCADGKAKNKLALQNKCGFVVDGNIPLIGFVGRLSHQKGVDLVIEWLKTSDKVQVVLQGVGEKKYEEELKNLEKAHPKRVKVFLKYDEAMAHQIYASSDLFLMPSRFEPCGLSQLIAMRYGCIPVVFKTGGLVDTVIPNETGIVFDQYTQAAFNKSMAEAIKAFGDKNRLQSMREKGMSSDFSWDHSAEEYEKIYQCLLSESQEV